MRLTEATVLLTLMLFIVVYLHYRVGPVQLVVRGLIYMRAVAFMSKRVACIVRFEVQEQWDECRYQAQKDW